MKRILLIVIFIVLATTLFAYNGGHRRKLLELGGGLYGSGTYYQPDDVNELINDIWDDWMLNYGYGLSNDKGPDIAFGFYGGIQVYARILFFQGEIWLEYFSSVGKSIKVDYFYFDYCDTSYEYHEKYTFLPGYTAYGANVAVTPPLTGDGDFRLKFGVGLGNYMGKLNIETLNDGEFCYKGSKLGFDIFGGIVLASGVVIGELLINYRSVEIPELREQDTNEILRNWYRDENVSLNLTGFDLKGSIGIRFGL